MPEIDEVPPQLPRFKNEESPLTRSGASFLENTTVQPPSVRTRSFSAIDSIGLGTRTTQEEVNSDGRMMLGSVGGSEFERPSVTRVDSGLKAFGYYPGNGNKTDLR